MLQALLQHGHLRGDDGLLVARLLEKTEGLLQMNRSLPPETQGAVVTAEVLMGSGFFFGVVGDFYHFLPHENGGRQVEAPLQPDHDVEIVLVKAVGILSAMCAHQLKDKVTGRVAASLAEPYFNQRQDRC